MKYLFDIVHPADVLTFYYPIRHLLDNDHDVVICARDKDIIISLLIELKLSFKVISKANNGSIFSAFMEIIVRDFKILMHCLKKKPDIIVGFPGISASHIGKLLGIKTIGFYDTEEAKLQNKISYPFLTELHVPKYYSGITPKNAATFNSVKELSYFHPKQFQKKQVNIEKPYAVIRLVDWRANHDWGKEGISEKNIHDVITSLEKDYGFAVTLISERNLSDSLNHLKWSGSVIQLHQHIANAALFIGESTTMAMEATLMKIPNILITGDYRGFLSAIADCPFHIKRKDYEIKQLQKDIEHVVNADIEQWHNEFIASHDDMCDYIVEQVVS